MIKIAICDDEISFQQVLKKELEIYYGALEITTEMFCSGNQFLETFKNNPMEYQIIFMDIEMPGLNGIDVSKQIRKINQSVTIIFLTSHTELAMEGYQVDAFRFLDKPLQVEKLVNTLRAFSELRLQDAKFELQDKERNLLVNWAEILYMQSENVYIYVVFENDKYLVRKKLSDIEKEMPKHTFYKPHRSFVINLKFVKAYDGKKILMKNGVEIPLSRGKQKDFKGAMMNYLRFYK